MLILVDAADKVIGYMDKSSCHNGTGVLHRAFSLFVFNPQGALLLQQRAVDKRLWPGYWSNSCCSHPRRNEALPLAVRRRCKQELGFTIPVQYLYKFEYHARYGDEGSEHELCSVFIGEFEGIPRVNTTEVQDWRWSHPDQVDEELAAGSVRYTPWFKLEWQTLRQDFKHLVP